MLKKLLEFSPLFIIGALAYLSLSPKNSVGQQAAPIPRDSGFWTVLSVSDGDTIKIRNSEGEIKNIRLCGVDAPEKIQPLGTESKANLQRLVESANNKVIGYPVEIDKYGRTVAEVFTHKGDSEKFLNEEQVKSGNAYLYARYSRKCQNVSALEKAEEIARGQHLGVWSRSDLIKPWDFRKSQR